MASDTAALSVRGNKAVGARSRRRTRSTALASVLGLMLLMPVFGAAAQDDKDDPTGSLLDPGQLVTTGFSGIILSDALGVDASSPTRIDETFLNPDGATLRILDIGGVPLGGGVTDKRAAEAFALSAREIGQVFGIAIDEAINPKTKLPAPNIYLGASSAYGLHVVVPDREGDGWPKRVVTGDPEATFMEGLWGSELGGDSGTIWKIDGVTGKPSVFAKLEINGLPNSGPGIGNVAYDKVSKLLFASDLETGIIVSFDLDGNVVGTFDHGVEGRPAEGLDAVEDDSEARANITSAEYQADNPSTWGYTQPPRRVWGLKTYGGRLYYAIAEGPEIWSVEIAEGGAFSDPRREIKLPADAEPYEIADISFTAKGRMVLAQRPPVTGGYDYVTPVASGPARLLRYREADNAAADAADAAWTEEPDEYAVGLKGDYRNTSGGIALGYGYKPSGGLDYGSCEATIWTTGEGLFEQQTRAFKVENVPGLETAAAIDGLQGTPIDLVRPDNLPPENARFVDYDGRYVDFGYRGHIGDVEIPYQCAGSGAKQWQPEYPAPWWEASYDDGDAVPKPQLDLAVRKYAVGKCRAGGLCRFEIRVTNRGTQVYYGPLILADTMTGGTLALVKSGPTPWSCGQSGAFVSCNRPPVFLKPGRSLSLWLTVRLASAWSTPTLGNCARVDWPAGADSDSLARSVAIELAARGFFADSIEAELTPELADAIREFQAAVEIAETGIIDRDLIVSLFGRGAWRDGDSNPRNDKGCAEHRVSPKDLKAPLYLLSAADKIKPLPLLKPKTKPIDCKPGYFAKKGTCVPVCAPGKVLKGGSCVYDAVELVCKGGKIAVKGKCVCPAGTKPVFSGGKSSCQKIAGITCDGGRVKNGKCICPSGTDLVVHDSDQYYCVPTKKEFICEGGKVRNGECVCRSGWQAVRIDKGHYQCRRIKVEPPQNDLVCEGGFVKGDACYCRKGYEPRRLKKGYFKCFKVDDVSPPEENCPPGTSQKKLGGKRICLPDIIIDIGPRIKCSGGKVVNGNCVCGKGYYPVKRSKRNYACVANDGGGDANPTPHCGKGEILRNGKCVGRNGGGIIIDFNNILKLKLKKKRQQSQDAPQQVPAQQVPQTEDGPIVK